MYYMIGGDGREYGPVSADQIRQWLIEGRANGGTLIRADGETAWVRADLVPGLYPEGAERQAHGSQPSGAPSPTPAESSRREGWTHGLGQREFRGGKALVDGASLFLKNFWVISGASLLVWLMEMVMVAIPLLGGVLQMALDGVLEGGLFMVVLRLLRGGKARAADALNGLGTHFRSLVLVGMFTKLLSSIGLLFFVLPGVFLLVAWAFAVPLVADRGLDYWPAMEISRRVVSRCWIRVALVLGIAFLPVLLALAHNFSMTVGEVKGVIGHGRVAMDKLQVLLEAANSRALMQQVVLLFTLPLGSCIVMCAYEQLFGDATSQA